MLQVLISALYEPAMLYSPSVYHSEKKYFLFIIQVTIFKDSILNSHLISRPRFLICGTVQYLILKNNKMASNQVNNIKFIEQKNN